MAIRLGDRHPAQGWKDDVFTVGDRQRDDVYSELFTELLLIPCCSPRTDRKINKNQVLASNNYQALDAAKEASDMNCALLETS